jgi:hypothetical protein
MRRFGSVLRATAAVLLSGAVLLLLGLPLCSSEACPMAQTGEMDRALCRAMGLDCCGASAGRVSHGSPQLAAPDLTALGLTLAAAASPAAALCPASRGVPGHRRHRASTPSSASSVREGTDAGDSIVVERLKQRAVRHGRSLQATCRASSVEYVDAASSGKAVSCFLSGE